MRPRHNASSAVCYWPAADSLWASETQPITQQTCSMGGPGKHKGEGRYQLGSFPSPLALGQGLSHVGCTMRPSSGRSGIQPSWLSVVQSLKSCLTLQPHGLQYSRLPCPSPTPRTCSNSCPFSRWCHPTISSSVTHFSCLQSFPASGSFLMSQFFASVGQSIEVSASTSVLPMTIQDWSPLGWTGWISLQSKGLSRVFSSTTVQMTLNWSSRSENRGAPEMRGWLGEEGSHQGNLGTRPHSSPIAPCACCLHGSSGGDTAPGAVPLRTPQGTETAASSWGLPMRKARVRGQGRAWREEEEEAGA